MASMPTAQMSTVSRHYFGGDSSEDGRSFYIDIIEIMQEDYGLYVWPCSVILAEYVWQQRLRFSGVSVVELGAGTSLPGLVAAKLGANVILTDNSHRTEVLENMEKICKLNKLNYTRSCLGRMGCTSFWFASSSYPRCWCFIREYRFWWSLRDGHFSPATLSWISIYNNVSQPKWPSSHWVLNGKMGTPML